jgi:hypothetical protein
MEILTKIKKSLQSGSRMILTSGFLASVRGGVELSELAGLGLPVISESMLAQDVIIDDQVVKMELPLEIETSLNVKNADVLLEALVEGDKIPYLTVNKEENIFVLNAHTFSQADFDAVGEVLLCPKPLGLLKVPKEWANTIREAFNTPLNIHLDSSVKVSLQTLGNGDILIHNYNEETIPARLRLTDGNYVDMINNKTLSIENGTAIFEMPPRSRKWLKPKNH